MKTGRLCKIELYRFFHSLEIVKYFVVVPVILFLMCYVNIFSVRNQITETAIWSSMSSIYMYLIASMGILIAIYTGREFRYKTINYELMKGYGIGKSAVAKSVSCGILVPLSYTIGMLVYLLLVTGHFSTERALRMLLLFVIYVHICSVSVLYVMICRNGVLGGILVFVRFYLMEAACSQLLFSDSGMKSMTRYFQNMQIFQQWYGLISIKQAITIPDVYGIMITAIIEYSCLLILLKIIKKHWDF